MESPTGEERTSGAAVYVITAVVIIGAVVVVAMFLLLQRQIREDAAWRAARSTMNDVRLALDRYKVDVDTYPGAEVPAGEDASWVIHDALCVSGPNAPYFDFRDACVAVEDPPGAFRRATLEEMEDPRVKKYILDPWGMPFRYRENDSRAEKTPDMHNPSTFDMYSCGPNRIDEGGRGDDSTNWDR
jgi:hypothetical protein